MTEKIIQLNTEKNIFWTLTGILFLCVCFYMYSIQITVRNVVLREELQSKIFILSFSVSESEFQYISAQNAVTLPLAYSMGFKDVQDKVYIHGGTSSLAYHSSAEVAVR